jgi:CBS domain containing-hemolysin-like protein
MTLLFVYLAIAVGVSFLCSILEAVLLSMTPSHVESLRQEHAAQGRVLTSVRQDLDRSLSAILILNTFAHTLGAAGVGSQAVQLFGARWETLIAVLLTLTILYFSEIIPKTLGATYWKSLALPAAYIITWLVRLTYPLVWLATLVTRLLSRGGESAVTRDEIIAMAALGRRSGSLFNQESEYLANVLNLREVCTEDVLTPRTVAHMLDESLSVSAALDMENTRRFSRIPLYAGDFDSLTGLLLLRDAYEAERAGRGDAPLKTLAKPIITVSEKLPVHRLLDEFIKRRAHLFAVEDEFGQTAGLVTLEDAIETMLGREIVDESDPVEDMQELARQTYRQRLRRQRRAAGRSEGS